MGLLASSNVRAEAAVLLSVGSYALIQQYTGQRRESGHVSTEAH